MVTPTPDVDAQLAWLIEAGEHEDLIEPEYQDPTNQSLFMARLMEVLRSFVGTKDVEALFLEAQSRHAPYGWVLPIEKVGENPQLEARDWWRSYSIGKHVVKGPGTPYQFSETPWDMKPYVLTDVDAERVLQDLGWDDNR
jgi:crotonobetainyl-CoA:carnitine CoA-transferase CaiB-like acyl-CoA transferase